MTSQRMQPGPNEIMPNLSGYLPFDSDNQLSNWVPSLKRFSIQLGSVDFLFLTNKINDEMIAYA